MFMTMRSSIPNETTPAKSEDGPEEGEIVSDDLEDISDDSIIFTPCIGKSLSRSDHLQALSLSSVTDLEDFPVEKPRKRKRSCSHRHIKRRKRSRRKLIDSEESSDDDTTLDRRLKLHLKAAVRVDVEAHKNSLRTRLRAMVQSTGGLESHNGTTEQKRDENGLHNLIDVSEKETSVIEIDSGTDSVSATEAIPIISATETILKDPNSAQEHHESGSEQSKDDIDSELMQLRIEALKTAINNKFANRKRRKKDVKSVPSDDTNKENTNNNSGEIQENKTDKVEVPQISPQSNNELENDAPSSPEEDEDVLRALLLASMSKKITNNEPPALQTTVNTVQVKPEYNKVTVNKKVNVNNFKLNNLKKVVNNGKNVVNKANTKLIKMPQVKPLIINVNTDSDSDLEFSSTPEKSPKKIKQDGEKNPEMIKPEKNECNKLQIENSVDKFLKEQRAKVESEVNKLITNNVESENIKASNAVTGESNKDVMTANSEIMLGQKTIGKNVYQTKNIALSTYKTPPKTIKTHIIANKNMQKPNSTQEAAKNLKLAELEKSALKFLPESKREEYKKLKDLLKLKGAQLKKPRVRRVSQKHNDLVNKNTVLNKGIIDKKNNIPKGNPVEVPVVPKDVLSKMKLTHKTMNSELTHKIEKPGQFSWMEVRNQESMNRQLTEETQNQERNSNALLLHTTLKHMQIRKNGRLQIRDRYQSLRPIIKKINIVSKEQKHWDLEVKRLLGQLEEARKKQIEVHTSMSSFIKDLAERKQKLDPSLAKNVKQPNINNPVTSTPLKQNISETSLDISAVDGFVPSVPNLDVTDHMPSQKTLITNHNKERSEGTHESKNDTWEQSTKVDNLVINEEETELKKVQRETEVELNVVDPNDIDKIIRTIEEKVAVLEKKESFECRRSKKVRYVSPLDCVKRKEEFDPFAIMCPFEVNGTCKDSECTFRHLPK